MIALKNKIPARFRLSVGILLVIFALLIILKISDLFKTNNNHNKEHKILQLMKSHQAAAESTSSKVVALNEVNNSLIYATLLKYINPHHLNDETQKSISYLGNLRQSLVRDLQRLISAPRTPVLISKKDPASQPSIYPTPEFAQQIPMNKKYTRF